LSSVLRSARLLRAALDLEGPVDPTSSDWELWTHVAIHQRVLPLLWRSVAAAAPLDDEQRAEAEAMQLEVAALSVELEQQLLNVADQLDDAEVEFVVLKGCATAHLDYVDPASRQFGDVDLLAAVHSFSRARTVLEESGWKPIYGVPAAHERLAHAIPLQGPAGLEIDLHRFLGHRALGLAMPVEELLVDAAEYEIAGRRFRALSDHDRLIHAAVHAISSRGTYQRLSSVADVLVLGRKNAAQAVAVLDRAETWKMRLLVEEALKRAHAQAMLPLPDAWSDAMRPKTTQRDRLLDYAYLGPRRRPVIEELAYLRRLSAADRLSYFWGHVRPDSTGAELRPRLRYLWSRLRQVGTRA
jgi:hypothetical protein